MNDALSDEQLMLRVGQGDQEAFTVLYDRYRNQIMSYIRRMLLDQGRTEECFQETFLRVYSSARRYDPSRPFRPWLYRIATNLCYDELTSYLNKVTLVPEPLEKRNVTDDPTQQIVAAEAVRNAMARLTPVQRSVIVLYHYQHLSYAEIAAALSIPIGTVKSRMNSALSALRADLSHTIFAERSEDH